MNKRRHQAGFTLVELLLAAAFFGFVLMFATFAFIQVNRSYNKGITVKRVHESTRQIMQDISRSVQSAASRSAAGLAVDVIPNPPGGGPNYLCVGQTRYIWYVYGAMPTPPFYLMKDTSFGVCDEAVAPGGEELDMLDKRLAVQDLQVTQLGTTSSYRITLTISIDEPSGGGLLSSPGSGASCNVVNGDQFCDVATLETVVTLRQ